MTKPAGSLIAKSGRRDMVSESQLRHTERLIRSVNEPMRKLLRMVLAMLLGSTVFAATPTPAVAAPQATAIFAGGCFWCMVAPFQKLPGVISVTSGYSGGNVPNPSYELVSSGMTGHAESVQVIYDPDRLDYNALLDVFWHSIDPTTPKRQFCDSGDQYRTAIFYTTEEQKRLAIASRDALASTGILNAPIVTEITAASAFYPAEQYHQDYYKKKELEYQIYRHACGRDKRLQQLYGDKAAVAH
jgi:peptide-methionine (S)-S-oxide reductase